MQLRMRLTIEMEVKEMVNLVYTERRIIIAMCRYAIGLISEKELKKNIYKWGYTGDIVQFVKNLPEILDVCTD